MRTHTCGELRISNVNQKVVLTGWCSKKRDLGGLIFIDLRDRYGITQLIVKPDQPEYSTALLVKAEYVIKVSGVVVERSSKNSLIPTGDIEINVTSLEIMSEACQTPLLIQDQTDALEDTRMKYRYLDIRRPIMQQNLILRHKASIATRNYFDNLGFIEVETPVLGKSTPEGARDFLVPSRVYPGSFFALPQSPQLYKQLLMIGGMDRYFQIVKCFRDEDLRADRQLEFTQIDVEMSFIEEDDIYPVCEGLLKKIWKDCLGIEISTPFPHIKYADAMSKYGSDKPDLRYGLELQDFTSYFTGKGITYFDNCIDKGGFVKGIVVPDASRYSRKEIDRLTEIAKKYHAQGLSWLKLDNGQLSGPIAKFIENPSELSSLYGVSEGSLVLIVADTLDNCHFALGQLRQVMAREMNMIDENQFAFCWVVDWPLFEYSEEEGRYMAAHHPFTSPQKGHEDLMLTDPGKVLAKAYDVVLNGYELGGGSIRIHSQTLQQRMFQALGFSESDIESQFGFFTDALKYGTPPHGGFAIGFDRLVMLLTKNNNLREIIAFPKTANSRCPMADSPSNVSQKQLSELKISTKEVK